jgi:hypothetical protein
MLLPLEQLHNGCHYSLRSFVSKALKILRGSTQQLETHDAAPTRIYVIFEILNVELRDLSLQTWRIGYEYIL